MVQSTRYVVHDVLAGELTSEIRRLGIAAAHHVRVTLDVLDPGPTLADTVHRGGSFAYLADEPDVYGEADIR
jgi:hypothetical protein